MKTETNRATSPEPASVPAYACSHCTQCGYNNFPPTEVCPKCWAGECESLPLSRSGVLYSFTTAKVAGAPHFVGYVDLPEKIRLYGLVETRPGELPQCGAPVSLTRAQAAGQGPCFAFQINSTGA
jgi:uncharacterized OB-fold protein